MLAPVRLVAGLAAASLIFATGPAIAATARSAQERFDVAIADVKATMQADPHTVVRKALAAEALANQIPDRRRRHIAAATADWLQGEAYLRLDQPDRAAPIIELALNTITKFDRGSNLHGNILLTSGGANGEQGEAGAALANYLAAHDIFRQTSDTRNRAKALMLIGGLYADGNDPETALRYLGQALDLYSGDPGVLVSMYNNRGSYLQDLGRYPEAEAQFRLALKTVKPMDSPLLESLILGNIAQTKLKAGDPKRAQVAINEALQIASRDDARQGLLRLLPVAARLALMRHDDAGAASLISPLFDGVDLSKTNLPFREAHAVAYDIYKAIGRPDEALVHLAALKRLDDQATKLATNTSTALMAARFNFANQELKISKLHADELQRSVAYEQARARTQRLLFLAGAAAVLAVIGMLAVGLVTIRRSRDKVRAANDDLAVTNGALAKALAAKTEFLATTSHEIRTPLNGILGMTEVMLADAALDTRLRDRLGVVHGAGVTMRALVDDILDIAKMETGNLTIEHGPLDLCSTVSDAARMWEVQAERKGLAFTIDMAGCPATIIGDAARIRQIVFNLLSNALKFTHAGAVTVALRSSETRLLLDITDSGIGIPADKLADIFESFRQADAGTTRQYGGTGLGLAISRNLARAMGGEIVVESVVGQGTIFTLDLPLIVADSVVRSETGGGSVAAASFLIVDRNPIMRSMFKTLVAPHVDSVLAVASVDEAVETLKATRVANILIDDVTVHAAGDVTAAITRIQVAAGDAATTLLWPASRLPELDALIVKPTRVVGKPVSGTELLAALFDSAGMQNNLIADLVSEAA